MTDSYQVYLDEIILAAAKAQTGKEVQAFDLVQFHAAHFPQSPETWLTTAATALHELGYGVDWQNTNNTSFRINGQGLLRAEAIRRERSAPIPENASSQTKSVPLDWGKWGAIAGIIALPLAIFLAWWFSN